MRAVTRFQMESCNTVHGIADIGVGDKIRDDTTSIPVNQRYET